MILNRPNQESHLTLKKIFFKKKKKKKESFSRHTILCQKKNFFKIKIKVVHYVNLKED